MLEFLVAVFFLMPTFFAFTIMFISMMEDRTDELFRDVSKNDKY